MRPRRPSPCPDLLVNRSRSVSRLAGCVALSAALAGLGCGPERGKCGSLARVCADEGRWLAIETRIGGAVVVDLDGDGEDESVVLTHGGKLSLAHADGQRSAVYLPAPTALAALPGEVAVTQTEPQLVAIFGVDGDGRLERRKDIVLSHKPGAMISSDLAGDGSPELIVGLPSVGRMVVIDPRTGEQREYAAGTRPGQLAVADIDGDANVDVVAIDHVESALRVFRGVGDGTLAAATVHRGGDEMFALTLADHDGDGDLDAIARDQSHNVLFHRNDGQGQFSSPSGLGFSGSVQDGLGVAVGPVAPSGVFGVSVPQERGLVSWFGKGASWLGRVEEAVGGPATWVGPGRDGGLLVGGPSRLSSFVYTRGAAPLAVWRTEEVAAGYASAPVATGDLDGDHLLDFAVAVGEELHLFRGRADLGFDVLAKAELSAPATATVIADVTGDGRSDIVVNEDARVRLMVVDEFGALAGAPSFEVEGLPHTLLSLRTGKDQPAAIVALSSRGLENAVLPGATMIRFAADGAPEAVAFADSLLVDRLVAVDFDADGVDEPLILGRRDDVAVLTRMTPDGPGFGPGVEHDLGALAGLEPDSEVPWRLAVGDLDGDGAPEAVATFSADGVQIAGLVDDAPVVTLNPDLWAVNHLRDVDRDGLLDAVALSSYSFSYRRGLGDGSFDEKFHYYDSLSARALEFAAVTDAQFDLVQVAVDGVSAHILRDVARPSRTLGDVDFHAAASEVAAADLDGDGRDEVVTVSLDSGGVAWMWGSETEPLARVDGLGGGDASTGLALGDLDGDGALEVLTADAFGEVRAFRPQTLREQHVENPSVLFGSILRLALADFDGDGAADILALNRVDEDHRLMVAYGTPKPFSFEPWVLAATAVAPESMQVGDVDGDGDPDILCAQTQQPAILVRNEGQREWAAPVEFSGWRAMLSSPDSRGRVDVVTQDVHTIYRHVDGRPDERVPLVSEKENILIAAGDADGDGRYDLVVRDTTGRNQATYVWLLGEDGPTRVQVAEAYLDGVVFPDVDGDGRPDLVSGGGEHLFLRRTRR